MLAFSASKVCNLKICSQAEILQSTDNLEDLSDMDILLTDDDLDEAEMISKAEPMIKAKPEPRQPDCEDISSDETEWNWLYISYGIF